MAGRSSHLVASPPATIRGVGHAVEMAMDAASALLRVAERAGSGPLRDQASAVARAALDIGATFRKAPDDIVALGQAFVGILERCDGSLAVIGSEADPAIRAEAAESIGAVLAANHEFNEAVRGNGVAWKSTWDRLLQ